MTVDVRATRPARMDRRKSPALVSLFPWGALRGEPALVPSGTRPRAACGPWPADWPESSVRRGCACEPGTRACEHDDGCWAGRCASCPAPGKVRPEVHPDDRPGIERAPKATARLAPRSNRGRKPVSALCIHTMGDYGDRSTSTPVDKRVDKLLMNGEGERCG
jgi:hypothetical protein